MKLRGLAEFSVAVAGSAVLAILVLTSAGAYAQKGGTTPPPNPEILFSNSGIRVMNSDGTNVRTIVPLGRGEIAEYPSWGPTGTSLVFGGIFADFGRGVYTANLDGTNRRIVVSTSTYALPKWATRPGPNGHYLIAYSDYGPPSTSTTYRDVFIVNPDGSGKVNITNTPNQNEHYCDFSRNASQVVFQRGSQLIAANLGLDGNGNVTVVSEQVLWANPNRMTFNQLRFANTFDGLVFQDLVASKGRLFVLDLTATVPTPQMVTLASNGDERFPSFSPDDSKIVFHRSGTAGGIFTVNRNGTSERCILNGSNKGFAPDWKRPAPVGP